MRTVSKIATGFFLMALGILIGWYLKSAAPLQDPPISHTTITTVPGDMVPDTLFFPAPYPVFRDTGTTRWRSLPVDTGAILAEYFSRNVYRRILKNDTSALVVITDTVTQNRLTAFKLEFQNRRATAIITNIYQAAPQYDFVLSGAISLAVMPERTRLMGGLQFIDQRQRSFQVMADPQLKGWMVGVGWPVWRFQQKVEQER
jgi:hypothetical protein